MSGRSYRRGERIARFCHALATVRAALLTAVFLYPLVYAELPAELPGEEVSQEFLNFVVPKDSVKPAVASVNVTGTGLPWLDKAQKTWEAPSMAEQISADQKSVPMGKGGIFIPRMTAARSEPNIEVIDAARKTVAVGEPGQIYSVEPGTYVVLVGSGARNQRIKRTVVVEEGRTVPLPPDWATLSIETIDSTAIPFRGEYELVRIDEFETYGRGYGANPDLGEIVKTWVLKPGIYKILGVGQGYNSLINFVTVRLLPGEHTRLLLVQGSSATNFKILGGGTVDVTPQQQITSNWKYGADMGGNLTFNQEINRRSKISPTTANTLFGLLSNLWLTYKESPYDWQTRIRLNEGFTFAGSDYSRLSTNPDDFLLNSLFIWRFFSWFGPYGRTEVRTNFLPRRLTRGETTKYFCILDNNNMIVNPPSCFDSSSTYQIRPSFAPITFDVGVGANADAVSLSYFDAKLRAGFGSTYSNFPLQYQEISIADAKWADSADRVLYDSTMLQNSVVLHPEAPISIAELGPQASVSAMVRIGRVATADAELKVFAPVAPEMRFFRPDFDLRSNLSWRLTRWVTLDYTYTFLLTQPKNDLAKQNESTHGVWLRFSFSSR